MAEGLDAFKSGQAAMKMNLFAFFPGLYKDPNVGGDKIGFFVNPSRRAGLSARRPGHLGGARTRRPQRCSAYIKWFATAHVQKKWWALGGYSCHKAVLNDASFKKSAPFAAEFLDAMDQVVDFWAEPSYAELLLAEQKRIHDFVVADKGTRRKPSTAWWPTEEGVQGRRKLSRPTPEAPAALPLKGAPLADRQSRIRGVRLMSSTPKSA